MIVTADNIAYNILIRNDLKKFLLHYRMAALSIPKPATEGGIARDRYVSRVGRSECGWSLHLQVAGSTLTIDNTARG